MGLDQYAYKHKPYSEESEELFYWRKHPDLHGWMQQIYAERTGDTDPNNFNCVDLPLTLEDILTLEADIKAEELPETSGFFFGESDEYKNQQTLKFISLAKEAITDGYEIYYYSWW